MFMQIVGKTRLALTPIQNHWWNVPLYLTARYAAPVPEGLREVTLTSQGAFSKDRGEFLPDYNEMRQSTNPAQTLLDFLDRTYSAAADLAKWDRTSLDRHDAIGKAAVISPD